MLNPPNDRRMKKDEGLIVIAEVRGACVNVVFRGAKLSACLLIDLCTYCILSDDATTSCKVAVLRDLVVVGVGAFRARAYVRLYARII